MAGREDKGPDEKPLSKGKSSDTNKKLPSKGKSSGKNKKKSKIKLTKKYSISPVHILWIGTCIALIISLWLAFEEAISSTTILNYILPMPKNFNVTETVNITEITKIIPEKIHPPFVPRFVLIWGFIGAATYLLKVTTGKMTDDDFDEKKIPEHIARLFVGTALAVVSFFILATGGFFGLTIDVTKIGHPGLIQYVYAVISFISGYSVRAIIQILSKIANSIFMIHTPEEELKEAEQKVAEHKVAEKKAAEHKVAEHKVAEK